jgi:hypothetical protein
METRMFPETKRTVEKDCPVCYAIHDEEIHEATLRLHGWFREQVTHFLRQEELFATANSSVKQARVA